MNAAAKATATATATGTTTTINELLRLDGIAMHYGTGETSVTALTGVDLKVSRGELVAIMGASGSGNEPRTLGSARKVELVRFGSPDRWSIGGRSVRSSSRCRRGRV